MTNNLKTQISRIRQLTSECYAQTTMNTKFRPCQDYTPEALVLRFPGCGQCGWGQTAHQDDLDSKWTIRADLSMHIADAKVGEIHLDPAELEIFESYVKELDIEIEARLANGETPDWMGSVEETLEDWSDEKS